MSIRGRMLLIVIALNLLVLGALQLAQVLLLERWRSAHRQVYEGYFGGILRDAYARSSAALSRACARCSSSTRFAACSAMCWSPTAAPRRRRDS